MKIYRVSKVRPDCPISWQDITDWREGERRFLMFGKCYVRKEDDATLYTPDYQTAQVRRLEFMQARLDVMRTQHDQAIQDLQRVRGEVEPEEAPYFKWVDDCYRATSRGTSDAGT